jgi:predicted dehydrogenase
MQRVCVIGCGPIGNLHADIYHDLPLADLVAVCDIDRDRADATAARLGVQAFYDAPTMFAALQPDLCSVATGGQEYGSDHALPVIQAFDAGCHVLCEKPISNSIPDAERMVAAGRAAHRCFGIDLNHRFNHAHRLAKQWVTEGRLGTLLFCNMAMWIMNPRESSPWFQIKALHPHTIDIMRYFCGDIEAVQCFAVKAPGRAIWSTAHFNMKFRNGAVGGLTGSYDIARGHPMERCEVAGTGGRFVVEDVFSQVTLYPADALEKVVYTNANLFGGMRDFSDTFRERIKCFVEQVDAGVAPEGIDGSGADGLAAQKVLAAAIESIETGTVVHID